MLKIFFKKGMYNLITKKYNEFLYVFENEVKEGLQELYKSETSHSLNISKNKNSTKTSQRSSRITQNNQDIDAQYCSLSPMQEAREMHIRYERGQTSPEESLIIEKENIIKKAEQKYHEIVFNSVCQDISKEIERFRMMLPMNTVTFNLPEKLTACTIYQFVYYCQYNKKIDFTLECQNIVIYVRKLMNSCL